MKKQISLFGLVFLAAMLTAVVGCGPKRPTNLPVLYPTTITIKCNGKPAEGISVRVNRMENEVPYFIGGTTNANGVAEMIAQTPVGSFKGAPEGDLIVTASKNVVIGSGNDSMAAEALDPTFTRPNTSQMRITVAKGGPNKAEFEVVAKPEFAEAM